MFLKSLPPFVLETVTEVAPLFCLAKSGLLLVTVAVPMKYRSMDWATVSKVNLAFSLPTERLWRMGTSTNSLPSRPHVSVAGKPQLCGVPAEASLSYSVNLLLSLSQL